VGDYVAFEGPPWVWILATFLLFAVGLALGALTCYALTVASRREIRSLGERVHKLEASRELGEQRITSPCFPWHTSARP
jgi:uncharacterized membrane protein YciS (DUF1049 family)